jgi:D-glycero-D-manno-heptose 1,7-bisphosphate phosphatase
VGVHSRTRRAVFLDRDGVINRAVVRKGKPYPPRRMGDLEILPGVEEALRCLRDAGFLLIVVTNQPDVARQVQSRSLVEAMHHQLASQLPIDEIRVCYHDDADMCECRKPSPGMLFAAAEAHAIDLPGSVMIGDRWRDIEAGRRAGCLTVFLDLGYDERKPDHPDVVLASLSDAASWILANIHD